ncbi:hypothetical protein RND61_16110 [Streptomyces sp. TRM76323]|uniref:Uncharacterized protein n=1 Tax=Streptomyces tamarix TaxID=3078565 RepID=A0ABU3QLH4_9ACTN|nr:hypothetical protein [Streptomyces tamarix]MDT9683574.1 hypothetical protein [Streptomyces tamarix]
MAVATVTPLPLEPWKPLRKKPLPAGRPREWYVSHNRHLKAMRLAIALLDSGVYAASKADDDTIRATAENLGIHPPSDTTCRLVRTLIRATH